MKRAAVAEAAAPRRVGDGHPRRRHSARRRGDTFPLSWAAAAMPGSRSPARSSTRASIGISPLRKHLVVFQSQQSPSSVFPTTTPLGFRKFPLFLFFVRWHCTVFPVETPAASASPTTHHHAALRSQRRFLGFSPLPFNPTPTLHRRGTSTVFPGE